MAVSAHTNGNGLKWRDRVVGFERRPAKDFLANPLNFRLHPNSQREAFRGLMNEVGFAGAILENKRTGNLIDGHLRIEEALSVDEDQLIPCVQVDLSPEEERLVLASFDPISAMAKSDKDKLESLLKDVSASSDSVEKLLADIAKQNSIAFKPKAQENESAVAEMVDKAAELQRQWKVKRGHIWEIGKHRLMCGDSTSKEDVSKLMNGANALLCFTSPPYAQQREYGESAKGKVSDWDVLMQGVFGVIPATDETQVLVNLGLVHRDGEWLPYWDGWIEWMRSQGWRRFGLYVWDQGPGMPGDWAGRFAPSFELVFHFNKAAVKPDKARECKHAGTVHRGGGQRAASGEVKARSHDGAAIQPTAILDSVIRVNRQGAAHRAHGHPAPFPEGLPKYMMESWDGDVYEPFNGSGTTMAAAQGLDRTCYGMEIEPKYCAVTLERLSALGLTPKLTKESYGKAA